jgi:DNA-directed RNA polymerase specialized sigma24 family protein
MFCQICLCGSSDDDKMAKNIIKLLDLISEHIEIMEKEEENLIRITNKIRQVKQPYKNILELRFISGMKVEEISVEIDKEYRYTKKLIRKSIKKYAEI